MRWPTDDQVWLRAELSFADWARQLGVSDRLVIQVLGDRGWRRDSTEGVLGLRQAPCRHCGVVYDPREALYPLRECVRCRLRPEVILEKLEAGHALTFAEEKALSIWRRFDRE